MAEQEQYSSAFEYGDHRTLTARPHGVQDEEMADRQGPVRWFLAQLTIVVIDFAPTNAPTFLRARAATLQVNAQPDMASISAYLQYHPERRPSRLPGRSSSWVTTFP